MDEGIEAVTLREAMRWAKERLDGKTERPWRAAEILLCEAAGLERPDVYARPELALSDEQWRCFHEWIGRHRDGEPIQYIVGREMFFGAPFIVNRHVLIPRPETELLVELVLKETDKHLGQGKSPGQAGAALRAADLGTGSGVIAVTLARLRPQWAVWAVDCSEQALQVAKENARQLGVSGIRWLLGDFCMPLAEQGVRVDVLVSNPPYVARPDLEQLDIGVRDFEPRLALDGGEDGLDAYRRIIDRLPLVLTPGALVAFELGIGQADAVGGLLQAAGFASYRVETDLAGIRRFVLARFADS